MIRIFFLWVIVFFASGLSAKTIVVLGDSISAGYGIDPGTGWVVHLQNKLDDLATGYQIRNESISGDTSAGGLARIDSILQQSRPEWVLLELGANDGLRGLSPQRMKQNLAAIIRRCQAANVKVLLLSMRIPPNYGSRYVELFYNVYPQLAKEENIPWVPFILEDVALTQGLMQKDRLHPVAEAQPLIADKIWRHLRPLLAL
jgi:acyl-CoA thioesterase-1